MREEIEDLHKKFEALKILARLIQNRSFQSQPLCVSLQISEKLGQERNDTSYHEDITSRPHEYGTQHNEYGTQHTPDFANDE